MNSFIETLEYAGWQKITEKESTLSYQGLEIKLEVEYSQANDTLTVTAYEDIS